MSPCEYCGKSDFANGLEKGRHMKGHKAETESDPLPVTSAPKHGKPAILPEWRQSPFLNVGLRRVKMLRPICSICQAEDPPRKNWMRDCPHEPYVSVVPGQIMHKRVYGDPNPDGTRPILRTEAVEGPPTLRPNRVAVALSFGISSGTSVQNSVWKKGRIFPEDLGTVVPSNDFPFGIAPACEFNYCFNQVGLVEYRQGKFCREVEAALVGYHEGSGALGVLSTGPSQYDQAHRMEQLAAVNTRVAI